MIVSRTPLRASLFGGGTDFSSYFMNYSSYGYGSVISTTLQMYIYIMINKRFDSKIRIVCNNNELVDAVEDVQHNIIREALKITGVTEGVEILYSANIPMTNLGLGLASSSALAVGVLNALHVFKGETVSKEQIAREACDLEINHLHQQIGIQDQFAVSYGGFNRYIFHSNGDVSVSPIYMEEKLKSKFMLFYTGNPRDSKQIFKDQNKKISDSPDIFDRLVESTNEAISLIEKGNYDEIGVLLDDCWKLKKQFSTSVSNSSIDEMYDTACSAGAIGGKILGAGGGGFLLLYVPEEKKKSVREALKNFTEIKFEIDDTGTQIVYQD